MLTMLQKILPFLAFGILLAGLWIAFRHQIGGPANAKSSIAFIGEGGNPYALKEAYIKKYLIYPGILFSVIGGIIAIVSAFTKRIPLTGKEWFYIPPLVIFSLLGAAWIVQKTTMVVAKKSYYPELVSHQREPYKVNRYLIQSGGIYETDNPSAVISDDIKSKRLESAKEVIGRVCDILEVEQCNDIDVAIEKLDGIFNRYK